MSRLVYDASKIGSKLVAEAIDHISQAQYKLGRAKALADSISGGGVTPASLEASPEFGVAVGAGANFYNALANIKANANVVTAAALADLDNGG